MTQDPTRRDRFKRILGQYRLSIADDEYDGALDELCAAEPERACQSQKTLIEALQNMIKVYWQKNADGTYGDGLPEPIVIKEARAALLAAGVEDVP